MNIHDYHELEIKDRVPVLLRQHILAKHEKDYGVMIIEQEERFSRTFGIEKHQTELLKKSIEYYSKKEKTKVYWCYMKDIAKSLEEAL